MVKEQGSHGEIDFYSFIAKNKDDEWNKIKRSLNTTHAYLQDKDDPVKALSEVMEDLWLSQLEKEK